VKVVFFLLGDFLASKFFMPTFLVHEIQTPGNHPNERIQHSEHWENFKSRTHVKAMLVIF